MTTKVPRNILIVDDEQDIIDLLALHFLKDPNYTISTANNGVAALEKRALSRLALSFST